MDLKDGHGARQTETQTEITEFIKADSWRQQGSGGSNLCDCQRADKWFRGKIVEKRSK